MSNTVIDKKMTEAENKYFNLVWYARKSDTDYHNPNIRPKMLEVEQEYPQEVADLKNDLSNWTNGFNSGMLAAARLFRAYTLHDPNDVETAEEEFLCLDT